MRGKACRMNYVAFGEYGLQSLEMSWVTGKQIEAGRVAGSSRPKILKMLMIESWGRQV